MKNVLAIMLKVTEKWGFTLSSYQIDLWKIHRGSGA